LIELDWRKRVEEAQHGIMPQPREKEQLESSLIEEDARMGRMKLWK
jgi:hypothetical protein